MKETTDISRAGPSTSREWGDPSWLSGDVAFKDSLAYVDSIEDVLLLGEDEHPIFSLAKNKARFLRMLSWYKNKNSWLEVAPLSGASRLFKEQQKLLENIRSDKMNYELDLEITTLTPSQRAYRSDEFKMCKLQEKMAVQLITRVQSKIKSGRR